MRSLWTCLELRCQMIASPRVSNAARRSVLKRNIMVPKATTLDEETGPELPNWADSVLVTHTNIQTDSIETETHRRNGYRAIPPRIGGRYQPTDSSRKRCPHVVMLTSVQVRIAREPLISGPQTRLVPHAQAREAGLVPFWPAPEPFTTRRSWSPSSRCAQAGARIGPPRPPRSRPWPRPPSLRGVP